MPECVTGFILTELHVRTVSFLEYEGCVCESGVVRRPKGFSWNAEEDGSVKNARRDRGKAKGKRRRGAPLSPDAVTSIREVIYAAARGESAPPTCAS